MTDETRHEADRQGTDDQHEGGMDRRGFLECMAWVGTGLVWTASGGILSSSRLGPASADISHAQKAGAFDTVTEALKDTRVGQVFYIPGENDVFADGGKEYLSRFAGGRSGWQSFDYNGVHFIGLINVLNYKAGGLGTLGHEQIEWLEKDVERLASSTPIVVFAHVPLWAVYPKWGWVTEDAGQALDYLKRFGSVTVLNGHIHQIMQKVEGNITFHTAMSTAFPQPAPGAGPSPGPLKVAAEQLRGVLGVREVNYIQGKDQLAIVNSTLA